MKKAELIILIAFALSILLKLFHIPGSGIFLISSALTLSSIYLCLSFALFNNLRLSSIFKKQQYADLKSVNLIVPILAGFALSLDLVSTIFILQNWPGAGIMMMVGLNVTLIMLAVSIFKLPNNRMLIIRLFAFLAICIIAILIPLQTWLTFHYPNHPEYVEALVNAQTYPDSVELQYKVDEEAQKIFDEKNGIKQ